MLIAQMSDPHLRPRGVLYQGLVDSNGLFATAVAQLNALTPRPDLVVLTGDVVDEGLPAEYALARPLLAQIRAPLVLIPGNHDDRDAFRANLAPYGYWPTRGPLHGVAGGHGPVRVIGLDVTLPGQHHGLVDETAAAWLDDMLAREPERPTVIMMHQPPFTCAVPYLDAYFCRGGERLAAIVSRYPSVERILCGHVHRLMMVRFAGTLLCTAPSTATAIALRIEPEAEPASFLEPPGFLLHHWRKEAGMVTHLVLIGAFQGPLPFA